MRRVAGDRDRHGRAYGARGDRVARVRPAMHRRHRDARHRPSGPAIRSPSAVPTGEDGSVYPGILPFTVERIDAAALPATRRTKVMLIVGDPGRAFALSAIPNDGVGLARIEFIITDAIGIHPMALARYPAAGRSRRQSAAIAARIGDEAPDEYFVRRLAEGVGRIAAAFYPEASHRADERLQDQRVRLAPGRPRVRADRSESDARLPGRVALLRRALRAGLRPRVPGTAAGARRDGAAQREGHDSVLPDRRGGPSRARR